MFFNIGHEPAINYSCHRQLGSFCISTDEGWTYATLGTAEILYKGYADKDTLDRLLEQIVFQTEPKLTGNFCAFVVINDTLEIHTDRYRSFPIYVDRGVNNLIPKNRVIWTDSLVTVHADLEITETKFDPIGDINTTEMTERDVIDAVASILDRKTKTFVKHNQLPIRVFLSGGVDSMLVYSFLRKHTDNFELVKCSHVDYDYFWLKNSADIEKFWGYTQIHHWIDPCVLTSGAPGDEFMLRSPTTADLFFKHNGIRIADLLKQEKWSGCLHRDYFLKDKHFHIFNTQQAPQQSLKEMHYSLCNNVVNDWQHWHLGNTLTWTPLRDIEIFKLMLRLPLDSALEQAMNSSLSIQLIERNCPGLSAGISTHKNSGNMLSNLVNVF